MIREKKVMKKRKITWNSLKVMLVMVLLSSFVLYGCNEEEAEGQNENMTENETVVDSEGNNEAVADNNSITSEENAVLTGEENRENIVDDNAIVLAEPENLNSQGYDVVYVIDNSRSVWSQQNIRNQAFRNITNLAVGSDVRIGVVYFADEIYDTLSLTSMETQEGSKRVLDFLDMTKQDTNNIDTNIGTALEAAAELFDSQDTSRERIVILFSDGINENIKGETDYTLNANKKTEEQTAILKKMDAQIYCVYLQKSRNDEMYLQKLVNYFSEEESYVEERFSKVKESEISTLSDTFAKVFFSMQNNMKYRRIKFESFDSLGRMSFYVPSLGIEQLQIYLDGDIQEGMLYPAADSEYTRWQDGTAKFFVYEEPAVGPWSIEIADSDFGKVHGAIVYYPNLQAGVELITVSEAEGDIDKLYQLIISFYDKEGKKIEIDSDVSVEAVVKVKREDGAGHSINLTTKVNNGIVESNTFTIDDYGSYSYEINLAYEDFVDLSYSIEGGSISKTAPEVYNISNRKFEGEKIDNGFNFSIKESELFYDLEGENVFIGNIVQLNAANPVTVEQEDGYINITAQNSGDINFVLQLSDASGMAAEVTVQGTVIDMEAMRMIKIIAAVVVGMIFVILCVAIISREKKKKELKNMFIEFELVNTKFNGIIEVCNCEIKKLHESTGDLKLILHGDEVLPGLVDMVGKLTEEQVDGFDVQKYLQKDWNEEMFHSIKSVENIVKEGRSNMVILSNIVKGAEDKQDNVKSTTSTMKECLINAATEYNKLERQCTNLKNQNMEIENMIIYTSAAADKINEMLTKEIPCDLLVRNISNMPNARGKKIAVDAHSRRIRGYYKLDDVIIGGRGLLGDNIGKTGIYVYGYSDDSGKIGLRLKSSNEFKWKQRDGQTAYQSEKEAIFIQGKDYDLIIRIGNYEVGMLVSVN